MCNSVQVGQVPSYVWSLNNPKDGLLKQEDSRQQAIVSNDANDRWLVDLDEAGKVKRIIMRNSPYTRQINGEKIITVGRWISMKNYLQMAVPNT